MVTVSAVMHTVVAKRSAQNLSDQVLKSMAVAKVGMVGRSTGAALTVSLGLQGQRKPSVWFRLPKV
jgi:hypothetical protein